MKNTENIKILIADNQFLIREGLKNLIERSGHLKCVGEALNYNDLIAELSIGLPDLLIIDHCCEDCFTVDHIKQVKELYPELNILVISSETNGENIKRVLKTGIRNYLLKECNETEILDAIEACMAKKSYYCSKIFELVLSNEDTSKKGIYSELTNREQEIITFTLSGLRTKEIAEKLFLSPFTVSTHKKNIFKKLGIKNSLELNKFVASRNSNDTTIPKIR